MTRLWVQIWLTVLAVVLALATALSFGWWRFGERSEENRTFAGLAGLAGQLLPPADADTAAQQSALARVAEALGADLTLRAADGALLAASVEPAPAVPVDRAESGVLHGRHHAVALRLEDGRWLLARRQRPAGGLPLFVGGLALAVALGAYPVVRRVTARLERLQHQVDLLGRGDLQARVEVKGHDEVAGLAHSFNQAAARIEALVAAQRQTLAAASHELRSPLARIRLAIELQAGETRPDVRDRLARDIAELDQLVDEILLASRLDAQGTRALQRTGSVDLLALVAEECARLAGDPDAGPDATADGEVVLVAGDRALLRRLVRNLLENARRHAPGSAVRARVARLAGGGARLTVDDDGPGVAEAERERIFAPFHRPPGMREGTGGGVGLGLALVRQIARLHGGDARCIAREAPAGTAGSGGTRFEVTLAGG